MKAITDLFEPESVDEHVDYLYGDTTLRLYLGDKPSWSFITKEGTTSSGLNDAFLVYTIRRHVQKSKDSK